MTVRSERPQRSGLLTTMIVILVLFQLLGIWLVASIAGDRSTHGQSVPGVVYLAILLEIVAIIALIGIWTMRRWGVYVIGAVSVIGLVIDLAGGVSPATLALRVALLAVLATAIRKQWPDFR